MKKTIALLRAAEVLEMDIMVRKPRVLAGEDKID
jgi:hypothetical protein